MMKHEIMKAYVEEKVSELVGSLTSFNFANDSPDSVSFLTNYSGKIVNKFLLPRIRSMRFPLCSPGIILRRRMT